MKPITIKIVFVVALGCAAAVIEARSSEKLNPEVCLWTALGVVVLFFNKNGRTASEPHESQAEKQDRAAGPHVPGLLAPDLTVGATVLKPEIGQAVCVSC